MRFRGSSVHTINDSGRISVPSKIREVLKSVYDDESLVLVIGRKCIVAYPNLEWEKIEEKLQAKPVESVEEENQRRRLDDFLDEVSIDKQGRILISPRLRQYAKLDGDCVILGRRNKIEIWNKTAWDAEIGAERADFEKLDLPELKF